MTRRFFHSAAACLVVLGCAASGVASCTRPECADIGTCAEPAPSSSTGADAGPRARDAALEAAPPPAKNPYGMDYPTENLGWTPRKAGSTTPGSVIPNVVFEKAISRRLEPHGTGILPSITSLQLADFFDPQRRTHDVIILVLTTTWDAGSKPFLEGLGRQPEKTIVLSALGEGNPPGAPPSLGSFRDWADDYYWAWHALDGAFEQLGNLEETAPPSSFPIVVLIDATTMELASLTVGTLLPGKLDAEIAEIRLRQ